jgi:AcrR family transcriptional regulator
MGGRRSGDGVRLAESGSKDVETPEHILNAALEVLARDGYQRMTVRAIAEEAGVNHALISYHFGGKENLLLAMLERLDVEKFSRQWQLYAQADVPLSQKWRQATRYFRDDLDDGFVRVQYELRLAARRNPEVARRLELKYARWRGLLLTAAREMLPPLKIDVPPELVISVLFDFWQGMDERALVGGPDAEAECFRILEYVGDWLEERERACLESPENSGT